jgi:hypothetical protein
MNPAYITLDVLPCCRGANLTGSGEISHLGVAISPSRKDRPMGISMVQLPSRRISTTRAIYSAKSDVGIRGRCELTVNVSGTSDKTVPANRIVAPFSHLK